MDDPRLGDGVREIKLIKETSNGNRIKVPAKIEVVNGRIEFLKSPFALKDEIKAMQGARWHGFEDKPRKIWSVKDSPRNHFQLRCMMGDNPYEWFDQPLTNWVYERPLYSYQKDLSDAALTYHYQIWGAEMGLGKAQMASSKIATPFGWITFGEVQVGDVVCDSMGGTTRVKGVYPRGVMEMFRVTFTDDSSTICGDDHLWNVRTAIRKWRDQPYETLELHEIVSRGLQFENGNNKHYIPMVAPIQYNEVSLEIHPYLMGYILGNGGLSTRSSNYITIPDKETVDRLDSLMVTPLKLSKDGSKCNPITYRITDTTTNQYIKKSGLKGHCSPEKFIPENYLYNTVANRVELLQGLCDSDGYAPDTGVEYSTTSSDLARDFITLVQSLGGTCHTEEKIPTYTYKGEKLEGRLAYRIYASFSSEILPFKLSRKLSDYVIPTKYQPTRAITKVESIGQEECICISVEAENQLYVTDEFIVTHNTLSAIEVIEQSQKPNWWWVGPKKSLKVIEREFKKWELMSAVNINLFSYEMMTKMMKQWEDGMLPPDGVVFDESSRLKSDHSQRTTMAQALADGIREEYGYGGYVLLMSGTPSPKTPLDWWSQCLSVDTWILTKQGPRQVNQLIDKSTSIRVRDQYYTTTGFYGTGERVLYTLATEEGYSIKATEDHRFFKTGQGWCQLKDLEPGDCIELANHKNMSWPGENTFGDGYLLGFLFGDGYLYYNKTGHGPHTTLPIYGRKKSLIPLLLSYLPPEYTPTKNDDKQIIHHTYISQLARKFKFEPDKQITPEFETRVSSDCLRGFLRGFFDTDGSVDYNRLRITLSQVSKERLLVVQRMLSYFGIRSKCQVKPTKNAKPSFIDGREIKSPEVLFILHITGDDAVAFNQRIGFSHFDKAKRLQNRIKYRHHHKTPTFVKIQSIIKNDVELTYDAEVQDAHCFAANGLLAHNCEIAWPGFLREGTRGAFEQRLAFMVMQDFATGKFLKRIGWKDDENKCWVCGEFIDAPEHDRMTCASVSDYHLFVPSKNEVAYLEQRLKGLVVVKHKKDCLDLPEKQYRIVECEPSTTTLRVAKAVFETAPNVITGLTLLRELSDGFQYRVVIEGTSPCPVCTDGTTEVWIDPDDEERIFQMIDMLDEEYVATLRKTTMTCPTCHGKQEIPRRVRKTRLVPTPKTDALIDLLDENEEQGRIVIFAGFTGSLDHIIDVCHKSGWNTVRCDGAGWRVEDKESKRIGGVEPLDYWEDTENNERVAFVAHPQSGGLSMTLTQARMSVFWSNDFNPESRSQAEDRIHRIGMDENKGATIVDLIHLPTDLSIREVLKDNRRLELLTMGAVQDALGGSSDSGPSV